jgi:hypothetical protein
MSFWETMTPLGRWMTIGLAVCAVAFLLAVGLPRSCGPDVGDNAVPMAEPPPSGEAHVQGHGGGAPVTTTGSPERPESAEEIFERFRLELTKEAERRSMPLAEVIKERIEQGLESSPPKSATQWDGAGLLSVLKEAFRDNPEPYLQAVFATLSGGLLEQDVKEYCSLAHRTQSVTMFETAYHAIPPGGNRSLVAGRWAALLCTTRGFEAAHVLITETLELPEERQRAAALLLGVNKKAELGLTPEQQKTLELEARQP